MELVLTRQPANSSQVAVTCDGQPSHTFDLRALIPNDRKAPPHPLEDPIAYGSAIYIALFPPGTSARRQLETAPDRLLLVTSDSDLDAVPWEYAYGPYGPADPSNTAGFLVLECPFVRGLPTDQRIAPPQLESNPSIIAIPSNPLSQAIEPLNIDGEWLRLREALQDKTLQESAITLERTRPPTLERLGLLVANQRNRIVHFMGHGGQREKDGAILCFEKDNGDLDVVTAKDFTRQLRGSVFLVTLNACASATPGETHFSNLAAALVRQKTPYALGMRFSIPDDDALTFSRTFYSYLVRGSSVEEAVYRVRLALARNQHRPWMVGMPVLYTALSAPATGFPSIKGAPEIREHQPCVEVSILPRAEGTFQGRFDELRKLGDLLTGDHRARITTIHGGGGQGKTALAREAVERFAYAWPGGVWATMLENLPTRDVFVDDLARFLGIATQETLDPREVERKVLQQLALRRILIVLDNAETLIEAVERNNEPAIHLAQFMREHLAGPNVGLLATSRSFLRWTGETIVELPGLPPPEGVRLFQQHVPLRAAEVDQSLMWELSEKVEGHPLSLRLLGSAFNASTVSFQTFVAECEKQLLRAENKYVTLDHRHRTLYASIETSVRYLDDELRSLLSGLWIFHAPFLPLTAVAIFDPQIKETRENLSDVRDRIDTLWLRGLLTVVTAHDGRLLFYYVRPTMRPYLEEYLPQAYERESLLRRFDNEYFRLLEHLYQTLDTNPMSVTIARQTRKDLERGLQNVTDSQRVDYLIHWARVLDRLGPPRQALKTLEQVLEIVQGQNQDVEVRVYAAIAGVYLDIGHPQEALALYERVRPLIQASGNRQNEADLLNSIAEVYRLTGRPQEALMLHQQTLPIRREVGDRSGEATTLNNMALSHQLMGHPQEALTLYRQALAIMRELGNRIGEAKTLNNMGLLYQTTGNPRESLATYEQALPIIREMGDRALEAATLTTMAVVYRNLGRTTEALVLYECILPLMREVENRAGEAALLNNIGLVYRVMGQYEKALTYYQQALPIRKEVGDRAGEATTLNNIAVIYYSMGKLQEALAYYEQTRSIQLEVGNRPALANTLTNIGTVHQFMGQLEIARTYYEQALPLRREVGDRAGEAVLLNNLAALYRAIGLKQDALDHYGDALRILSELGDHVNEAISLYGLAALLEELQRYDESLAKFQQSIQLAKQVSARPSQAAGLVGLAVLLYRRFNRVPDAIDFMEQAISVLVNTGLSQDASGQNLEYLQLILYRMHIGDTL